MSRVRDIANILSGGSSAIATDAEVASAVTSAISAQFVAGKNKIINGDFGIWQRGTTLSSAGYLADRWQLSYSVAPTTFTQSRQTFTPGTAPVAGYEGQFFWRYAITTLGSNTDYYFSQSVENVRTFAGQTMTFSIYLRADSARTVSLYYQQNFGSGGSTAVSGTLGSFSVTTSFTRFTATVAIPSIAGKTVGTSSYLQFFFSGTPASGFSLDCWGAQAENGSVATAFQTATGTIQGETSACQRYYWRTLAGGNQSVAFGGNIPTTNIAVFNTQYPVLMRSNPTFSSGTAASLTVAYGANQSVVGNTITGDVVGQTLGQWYITVAGTPFTIGGAARCYSSATSGYVEFSAEL